MTLKTISRIAMIFTVGILGVAICVAEAPEESAAFVEGSVPAIPPAATGALDLGDSQNLHFRYGDSQFSIPADQITGYKWHKRGNGGFGESVTDGADAVGRTLLPMFFDKTKYLTINFKPSDRMGVEEVVFEVRNGVKKEADPVLKSWVATNKQRAARRSSPEWWGDRYYKTSRNRHIWENEASTNAAAQEK